MSRSITMWLKATTAKSNIFSYKCYEVATAHFQLMIFCFDASCDVLCTRDSWAMIGVSLRGRDKGRAGQWAVEECDSKHKKGRLVSPKYQ
jgi:hypothetical protein